MDDLFSIRDKVVHVSKGSRGIGRTLAQACQTAGARVAVSSRDEATPKATGLPCEVCDVADSAQIRHCVDNIVRQYGRLQPAQETLSCARELRF
jgi:NAD(P)-dependent dehydrogenase (short-subunit alcohol dehydrogenase family)